MSKMYSADTETTTLYNEDGSIKESIVYVWGIMDVYNQDDYIRGRTIKELFDTLYTLPNNSQVYFHNEAFDGSFIINYILSQDAIQLLDEANYYFNSDLNGLCKIALYDNKYLRLCKYLNKIDKENNAVEDFIMFKPNISDMGQWYRIELIIGVKGEKPKKIVLLDSFKILTMSVSDIAKEFLGIKGYKKLEMDYSIERLPTTPLTPDEWKYLKRDIEIVAKALYILKEEWGITKNTTASAALENYKSIMFENYNEEAQVEKEDLFRSLYPILEEEEHNFAHRSYKGGMSYVSPNNKNVIIGDGTREVGLVIDANSLYPSQMRFKKLPFGKGEYFKGEYIKDNDRDLYIQRLRCSFKLKKNCIPTIMLKSKDIRAKYNMCKNIKLKTNEYLETSKGQKVELVLTSVDLEIFEKQYEIKDIEYVDGYKYQSVYDAFKDYIDYWIEIKAQAVREGNKSKKAVAKLMLNALYGKFGSKVVSKWKFPYLANGVVKWKVLKQASQDPIYMPMASFITSYGRQDLVKVITLIRKLGYILYGEDYDAFAYCDTDSAHFYLTRENIERIGEIKNIKDSELNELKELKDLIDDGTSLGKWKIEEVIYKGVYLRAKTYLEQVIPNSEIENAKKYNETIGEDEKPIKIYATACAGLPKKEQGKLDFDNFKLGEVFEGVKLLPKQVKGGVALVATDFTIKK